MTAEASSIFPYHCCSSLRAAASCSSEPASNPANRHTGSGDMGTAMAKPPGPYAKAPSPHVAMHPPPSHPLPTASQLEQRPLLRRARGRCGNSSTAQVAAKFLHEAVRQQKSLDASLPHYVHKGVEFIKIRMVRNGKRRIRLVAVLAGGIQRPPRDHADVRI